MGSLPSPVRKLPSQSIPQLAKKYFPGLEDKILYLINGESGGNATAVGDGGAAYGLFQSHYIKPGASVEEQFKDARRLYDARIKAGGNGFEDWGEGNLYQGKPFGALGNHPYQGGPQGQTVTGRASTTTNYGKGDTPVTNPDTTDFRTASRKVINSVRRNGPRQDVPKPLPSPVQTYKPISQYTKTGKYDDDMNGYSQAEQAALDKLDGITDRTIEIDESNPKRPVAYTIKYRDTAGHFYNDPSSIPDSATLDIDDNGNPREFKVVDPEATNIAIEAHHWHQAQIDLDTKRKAGLTQSGDDAAKAYLESEKGKAANYDNYITRMKDLIATEDLPTSRAMTLANALSAANTANAKQEPYAPHMHIQNPTYTNMTPFAEAIKKTIPAQAPPMPNLDPAAFKKLPPPNPDHPLNQVYPPTGFSGTPQTNNTPPEMVGGF